jgi:TNF receptor-associated protein 1
MTPSMKDEEMLPLEIRIFVDASTNTFIIQDTGIGMTEAELIAYLGTIAHSGTKTFLQQLQKEDPAFSKGKKEGLIGQFGVGFYSCFMVSEEIRVYSRSSESDVGHEWLATHTGSYQISKADHVKRGTKILLKLKDTCEYLTDKKRVADIIKRYSNFVNFPIYLNDERINTVQALWNRSPSDIQEEAYTNFYQFICQMHLCK